MIKLTVKDLLNNCDCKLLIGDEKKEITNCFINSKDVTLGSTFFGIKGKNIDGSLFYKDAFSNGADICIINKIYDLDLNGFDDKTVIIANDTIKVLHQLASYKRSLFNGKVIMITGSVGKTSTKEMIYNVLKDKYKVLKTNGNQNSQIGFPLNILRIKDEEVLVLEAGMNQLGQIHNLSMIAKPDIAIITNVLDSHIGNLGTRQNILNAKMEIIDGMENGTLIINNDNDMLNKIDNIKDNIEVLKFGIENKSDIMARIIKEDIKTTFFIDNIDGFYIEGAKALIYNALATYATSKILGLHTEMIREKINTFNNEKHRLEKIYLNNNIILIDDCYNASYESVKLALDYLKKFKRRKIVVLADILELGKESKKIHRKIGNLIVDIDKLITIGNYSKYIYKQAIKNGMKRKNIKHFKTEQKSRKYIKNNLKEDDIILIKGSNGMNLINLVENLKNDTKNSKN